ncbi:Phage lysin glycosyl hydrolase family 25 [Lactiplantibacillus plantarum]|uniref:phage tail spike protein n=1 Tax=Lactiplantibacillus plantarum TaxID=1590 RepID=UPI0007BC1830|nr:phage tail spike protein [Lactiplantibacillus plantarum]KZT95174.1 Phage lysin glycosyl hydrolase family 25 [Lactiplantibacillus plantarum]KZT97857.1 Phage lysin glycosyl hydrolase family 25 [Lactiplantibacillus plantarum]
MGKRSDVVVYKILVRETYLGNEESINEPDVYGNRIVSGNLSLVSGGIDTGTLTISLENTLFNRILPYRWFIRIEDLQTKKTIFRGRFIKVSKVYSTTHTQTLSFESELAYLHDSAQVYREIHNTSVNDFLKIIVDEHNRQVDDFKKITLGTVNVTNSTDNVYRYLDETKDTLDNITDNLVNRLGGFLRIGRNSHGQLILDYVNRLGTDTKQTIELGVNLKSFTRNLNVNNLITRLIPLGAEKAQKDDKRDSNKPIPKIDISSVNNGRRYLDDPKLIDKFGIIENVNVWDDVHDAGILKTKGEQYLEKQVSAEIAWSVDIVNLALIDKRFQSFTVGNSYRIIDKFMDIDETISVSEKEVDLVNPQTVTIKIGNQNKNLTSQQINQARVINQLKSFSEYITSFNMQNNVQISPNESHPANPSGSNPNPPHDQPSYYNGAIVDVSEFQSDINWSQVGNAGLALGIIRIQDGSNHIDAKYVKNIQGVLANKLNYAVYAFFRGVDESDSRAEARAFYRRVQSVTQGQQQPRFYALDVETIENNDMRGTVNAYISQLNDWGVPNSQIVLYIANHLYQQLNLDTTKVGSIWIPSYGTKPLYPYDLWQYTDKGTLDGINTKVDMNQEPSERFKNQYLTRR